MNQRLKDCLEFFVLDHEGRVNENVPGDPGGKTHWGITQDDYDAYRREHGKPTRDVFKMTVDEVYDCYEEHYWVPMHCDTMPKGLDLALFDTAVNMGVRKAVKILQQVLGLAVDGVWGPKTTAKLKDTLSKIDIAKSYMQARENAYRQIVANNPRLRKFLKGWLNRCEDLRTHLV